MMLREMMLLANLKKFVEIMHTHIGPTSDWPIIMQFTSRKAKREYMSALHGVIRSLEFYDKEISKTSSGQT